MPDTLNEKKLYSILPEYRHMAYGTHSILLFVKSLEKILGRKEFQLKVMADNIESQGLMGKIGAKLVGITSMPTIFGIDEEQVEKNTQLITPHMEKLASTLGIKARKLLSHPLDYRICLKKGMSGQIPQSLKKMFRRE